MNILRVIPSMNAEKGGPSEGIRNSIPILKRHGINNEVVCFDNIPTNDAFPVGFPIIRLGPSKTSWQYSKLFVPWLMKNYSRFDAIIIHGLWLYHSYATTKTLHKLKMDGFKTPKVYVMPHGMLDPYFQKAKGRRIKAIRNWIYWNLIEKKVVNNADSIFFTSEEELLLARETFVGYHPNKEVNIGYGITTPPALNSSFHNAISSKLNVISNAGYLLFLSRLDEKKGIDVLLDAYLNLEKKGLQLPNLIVAGPGLESEFGISLRKTASESKSIIFPGMLSGDAKWGAFYGCLAFILPSHQENFGISVVEALACGKPVLISNKVNIWQDIVTHNAGYVENDDLAGTEKLLTKWTYSSDQEKALMSENAKSCFHNKFALESTVHKLISAVFGTKL